MFGIGFFELVVILIVAIMFLGPDKLPKAIIDAVKFFKAVKKTIDDAKDTFNKEINLEDIKKDALKYRDDMLKEGENIKKDVSKDLALEELNNLSIFEDEDSKIDKNAKMTKQTPLKYKEDLAKSTKNKKPTKTQSKTESKAQSKTQSKTQSKPKTNALATKSSKKTKKDI